MVCGHLVFNGDEGPTTCLQEAFPEVLKQRGLAPGEAALLAASKTRTEQGAVSGVDGPSGENLSLSGPRGATLTR